MEDSSIKKKLIEWVDTWRVNNVQEKVKTIIVDINIPFDGNGE